MKNRLTEIFSLSKKSIWITVCVLIVIVVIGIVCLLPKKDDYQEKCDKSLQATLDSVQFDEEAIPLMIKLVEERNGYELLSIRKKEDTYVGILRVFAPDVYTAVKKVEKDDVKRAIEDMQRIIEEEIEKADIVETEIELKFQIEGENIVPILTSDFIDAYYGGVYRLREEIIKGV